MNKIEDIIRGLIIIANHCGYIHLKTGVVIAGPEFTATSYNFSEEEHKMLSAAGWVASFYYNRWVYICA